MVVREKEGRGSGGVFRVGDKRWWIVRCVDGESGGVMVAERSVGI